MTKDVYCCDCSEAEEDEEGEQTICLVNNAPTEAYTKKWCENFNPKKPKREAEKKKC